MPRHTTMITTVKRKLQQKVEKDKPTASVDTDAIIKAHRR